MSRSATRLTHGPCRVLIVDDDAAVREVLRLWLEEEGYIVREMACGQGVVQIVGEWTPDCVLLDMLMIPVDGLTVLRELQAEGLTPGVPVIVLSAFLSSPGQAKLAREMRARGARGWLPKPLDFERLKVMIDHPPEPLNAPWNEESA